MSTQTEHLKLDLREAADIFNPLSTNANFESLDNIIYEIQTKGGVPTYTTTASANLLKLSQNPTPNVTVFKFVAAGDANTWSYQETVNDIVALDGSKKTVKGGEMYVAWVNAANAMVVIAWPDVVNAQTFNGKGPAEWATKAQLDAVNQTAANATQTAQAAATVANNALAEAQAAGMKMDTLWTNPNVGQDFLHQFVTVNAAMSNYKFIAILAWADGTNYPFLTFMVASGEKAADSSSTIMCSYRGILPGITSVARRAVRVESDTSLFFDIGYYINAGSSTATQYNGVCVPFKVFGIK